MLKELNYKFKLGIVVSNNSICIFYKILDFVNI